LTILFLSRTITLSHSRYSASCPGQDGNVESDNKTALVTRKGNDKGAVVPFGVSDFGPTKPIFLCWTQEEGFVKRLFLIAAVLVFSLSGGCDTCKPDPDTFSEDIIKQLDDTIATMLQDMNLPGAVVAVWVPGEGEYLSAEGLADLETGTARNLQDSFRIASITKVFVATAVLQLVDQGFLKTSDTLATFFPDFPNAGSITVRNLLRMRSGIADYADAEMISYLYQNPFVQIFAEDAIALSAEKSNQFEVPGQTTVYCNVNYTLLGEIVAKITGSDIGTYITRNILEPLGMENSVYPSDSNLPGGLHGYSWDNESGAFVDMTQLNPLWAGAGGAMISTIADLKIFAREVYAGRLLSEGTRKARLETQTMQGAPDWIGYGEGILDMGGFWGHNGTIFGFSSEMWYLPEKDAVILINVNRLDVDDHSQSTNLFFAVAKILFPDYVKW